MSNNTESPATINHPRNPLGLTAGQSVAYRGEAATVCHLWIPGTVNGEESVRVRLKHLDGSYVNAWADSEDIVAVTAAVWVLS